MNADIFFKHIESHYGNMLPFVVYKKPKSSFVKALLQGNDSCYIVKNFTEQGFVFSPYEDIEKTILIPYEASQHIEMPYHREGNIFFGKEFSSEISLDQEKINYCKFVKQAIETIQNSSLKKVVLSRADYVPISETNPISIFKALLKNDAFVYLWYHPKIGLWIGATPESLINVKGHHISVMALAGTQDDKPSLDISWGSKEIEEQRIVTRFIVDKLRNFSSDINTSPVETVTSGHLLHLQTIISGELDSNVSLKQVISALHPTPAICGVPQQQAKAFISENEGYNREFYTGFLGEINYDNVTALYVNLRCMQLKNNHAIIYVGGGITADSNPEKEWQETVSKSQIMKTVLL